MLHKLKLHRIREYRFKLLAILLALYLVLPPLGAFPALELAKSIGLKVLLILVGGEFLNGHKQKIIWYLVGATNIILGGGNFIVNEAEPVAFLLEYLTLVVMVITVFYLLMKAIAAMKDVSIDGIMGAFAGYVLLGLVAFLIYLSLQLLPQEMFSNLGTGYERIERLFYYSFVSLTTIGFGDIVPIHPYAQKLTIFFGIVGQFYMAVNVAILVSKYLRSK